MGMVAIVVIRYLRAGKGIVAGLGAEEPVEVNAAVMTGAGIGAGEAVGETGTIVVGSGAPLGWNLSEG